MVRRGKRGLQRINLEQRNGKQILQKHVSAALARFPLLSLHSANHCSATKTKASHCISWVHRSLTNESCIRERTDTEGDAAA